MIYTVTINSAIDHVIHLDRISQGKELMARESSLYSSGKGVNVSRTLSSLGYESVAYCVVGHDTYSLYKKMASDNEKARFNYLTVPGKTRINTTLVESEKGTFSHISTEGFKINKHYSENLTSILTQDVKACDTVVISGSLPPGVDGQVYYNIISSLKSKGARVVLDSSGDGLVQGVKACPDVILPNRHELNQIISEDVFSKPASIVDAISKDKLSCIKYAIATQGEDGVIARSVKKDNEIYRAWLEEDVEPINPMGAGDALAAGFIVTLLRNDNFIDALKYGVACGAANVLTLAPGLVNQKDIDDLLPAIKVRKCS